MECDEGVVVVMTEWNSKVKLSLCLSTAPWRRMWEWMYRCTYSWPRSSWRWVASFTRRPFYPGEEAHGKYWIGWLSPKTGLDDVERREIWPLSGLELRSFGRPARSLSLYRLHYPGSSMEQYEVWISFEKISRNFTQTLWCMMMEIFFSFHV
jgi:hypothetical protein